MVAFYKQFGKIRVPQMHWISWSDE